MLCARIAIEALHQFGKTAREIFFKKSPKKLNNENIRKQKGNKNKKQGKITKNKINRKSK